MRTIYLFLIIIIPSLSYSQWLEPETIQATVLIEKMKDNKFYSHGTGFLLYNYENPKNYIIVTCAHLIKNRKEIFVRMNIDSTINEILKEKKVNSIFSDKNDWIVIQNNIIFRIYLKSNPKTFVINDSLDIGAFLLNIPILTIQNDTTQKVIKFAKKLGIPKSGIKFRDKLSLGDEVYFIGFPFGIGASNIISPLVRSGSIAWLSDNSSEFLLDSFSFGGNSGSPVFCKVLLGTKVGQIVWDAPKLIGMIIGHHGIKLDNILTQPNPNELKFEKGSIDMNFGLARCVFIDDILKVTEKLLSK